MNDIKEVLCVFKDSRCNQELLTEALKSLLAERISFEVDFIDDDSLISACILIDGRRDTTEDNDIIDDILSIYNK